MSWDNIEPTLSGILFVSILIFFIFYVIPRSLKEQKKQNIKNNR
jgi:preprotein translocase subunit YajC